MKVSFRFFVATLLALLLLCAAPQKLQQVRQQFTNSFSYSIEADSKLYLEGSSNVMDFTCDCTKPTGNGRFSIQLSPDGYVFENSPLQIPVRELDCGNRGMNRDMYDALKAEHHPTISIKPVAVKTTNKNVLSKCDEWSDMSVDLQLNIAGVTQTVSMQVKGAHLGYQLYRFVGHKAIYLTDFGIEPPRALLGAIRVDNCVTINMDLLLRLSPA